jgi:hypothetical protein
MQQRNRTVAGLWIGINAFALAEARGYFADTVLSWLAPNSPRGETEMQESGSACVNTSRQHARGIRKLKTPARRATGKWVPCGVRCQPQGAWKAAVQKSRAGRRRQADGRK